MHIEHITIRVQSMETSLKFYKELIGLVEKRRINPREGLELVFLDDGTGSTVELVEDKAFAKTHNFSEYDRVHIGFGVDNISEAMERVKNFGLDIARGPIQGSGAEFIYIYDPNGVLIQLIAFESH